MSDLQLMEKLKHVQDNGASISAHDGRLRILKVVLGVRLDTPAEYAIITGCRAATSFVHLAHLVKLLRHYKVDYTFLSQEMCCGNSFLDHVDPKKMSAEQIQPYEDYAREFEGKNVGRIRALGIKKIVTVCAGCNTRYNQFQSGHFEVLYYTQLLARYVDELKLGAKVNFYEGCHKHHRTANFKIDTTTSRALLSGVKDLDVTDIPNFCCRNLPERIFERADTDTIVTPTPCCWWNLSTQKKADSPRVVPLTQLMCEALGIGIGSLQ